VRFRAPQLNTREHRLSAALTIWDLRDIAKRRTPRVLRVRRRCRRREVSLARARQAFEDIEFHSGILRDVSKIDTSSIVLGDRVALPFGIAPTGFTRMMARRGRVAGSDRRRQRRNSFRPLYLGYDHDQDVKSANPTVAIGSSSTSGRTAIVRGLLSSGQRPRDTTHSS